MFIGCSTVLPILSPFNTRLASWSIYDPEQNEVGRLIVFPPSPHPQDVKALAQSGCNVVVTGGKVGELALHFLNKYNIMTVR